MKTSSASMQSSKPRYPLMASPGFICMALLGFTATCLLVSRYVIKPLVNQRKYEQAKEWTDFIHEQTSKSSEGE